MKVFTKNEIFQPRIDTGESGEKILHGSVGEPIREMDIFEYEGDRYAVTRAWQSRSGNFYLNHWAITAISSKTTSTAK